MRGRIHEGYKHALNRDVNRNVWSDAQVVHCIIHYFLDRMQNRGVVAGIDTSRTESRKGINIPKTGA